MSDVTTGAEAPSAPVFTPAVDKPVTVREATSALIAARTKQAEPEKKPAENRAPDGKFAPAEQKSAPEGADAGPDTAPGEINEDVPADEPSIDPPRSWSKEDKELFASLPRETQERLSDRERSRESDFLKRQNETADKSKAAEAERTAAEQARQHYEQAAQSALQVLVSQQEGEFSDIKSPADAERLSREDPFRFIQYAARRDAIAMQMQQVNQLSQARQADEKQRFDTWAKEQDDKFTAEFKEFGDPDKAPKLRDNMRNYLTSTVGIPEKALPELWNTALFRDAYTQRIMYDAMRFSEAQKRASTAAAVPKPPVLRPGTSQPKGGGLQDQIAAATERMKNTSGINQLRVGAELLALQRRAAARRT
jgi:hypothetical protein